MYQVVGRVNWSHHKQITFSCRDGEQEHSTFVLAHGDPLKSSRVGGEMVRRDSDFNGFLAGFEDTYFYTIWKHLVSEYGHAYRMRLINLESHTGFSFHEDFFHRIHIPIITNDSAFFFINESDMPVITDDIKITGMATYHLPSGGMYLVDTTKHHTVYNGGSTDRVHLVCSI
jgi:hypothetical protein